MGVLIRNKRSQVEKQKNESGWSVLCLFIVLSFCVLFRSDVCFRPCD